MSDLLVRPEEFRNRIEISATSICSFEDAEAGGRPDVSRRDGRQRTGDRGAGRCLLGDEFARRVARDRAARDGFRRAAVHALPADRHRFHGERGRRSATWPSAIAEAEEEYPARLVTPAHVGIEIRGGGNATRQINSMLPPTFLAHRLMVVEVFTPAGNWSSFPPHKHDVHNPPDEVDLEEIYYYRIQRPEGFAVQKVYTRGPAHRRDDDGARRRAGAGAGGISSGGGRARVQRVLSERAGGFGAVAGGSDDPDYAWVRSEWKEKDPRAADG